MRTKINITKKGFKIILNLILPLALTGFSMGLYAQQDPQNTMFYFNKMFFNPAFAGSNNALSATLQGRIQWNGLPGAPITWVAAVDVPIVVGKNPKNQIGIGITGYGHYIGFSQDHGVKVATNYRRQLGTRGFLAFGMDIGFVNKAFINPVWVFPDTTEPGIPTGSVNQYGFDMGAGVSYQSKRFYIGTSLLHLTASDFPDLNMRQARHMYFNTGYCFLLGKTERWKLNPNVIVRTDFATANFDINLNTIFDINEVHGIMFGCTYRFIDAVCFNVGYKVNFQKNRMGLMLAYNYDINTSRLNTFNSGSHEIVLRYCFNSQGLLPNPKTFF